MLLFIPSRCYNHYREKCHKLHLGCHSMAMMTEPLREPFLLAWDVAIAEQWMTGHIHELWESVVIPTIHHTSMNAKLACDTNQQKTAGIY